MKLLMIVGAAAASLAATAGHAQDPAAAPLEAAQAAFAECLSYVEGPPERRALKSEAKASFERAERAFRAAVAAAPRDADTHAGLGLTLSRCGIPHAGMTAIMAVVEESSRALETALSLEPTHWQARFALAMNSFNMPSFLQQMPHAIRELETLLGQQAGRSDMPHFALTYMYLGEAYQKTGRLNDARVVYAAGARLFPQHAELQRRTVEAGEPTPGSTVDPSLSAGVTGGPSVYALAPLRIEGVQHQLEDARSGTSLRRLDIYTMPGGTGEMLQTLQTLPGATRAGDGADLYVRGGDPEETPVFVNGGRLAFPGRWEGLSGSSMGVLDASVLSRAYFSAGGFSAKYGNALSGVVDVETRGRPTDAQWRVDVNTVSAGASVYRPLGERAGAWGALQLTDVSLVTRMQRTTASYPDAPRSYQLFGGGSFDPVPGVEVKFVGVAAGDESARVIDTGGYSGAFRSAGHTQHAALSGRWLRTDGRVGVTGSATTSRREGGFEFGLLQRDRTDEAYGARVDLDVVGGSGLRVRAGLESAQYDAVTAGRVPLTRDLNPGSPARDLDNERARATHTGGYIEAEQLLAGTLVAVVGLRADRLPDADGASLDPRAALAYTTGAWTLRAGGGVFSQGSWRRTYRLPDGGTPTGAPTRARHAVVGAERSGEPAVRVEAYAKLYDRYVAGEGGGPAVVEGLTRGMDAIVRWQRQSRLNGWITWSLLDSGITLADGAAAPARFDVTHSVTGVARLALTPVWEVGSTVRYATGKPYTPVIGTTAAAEDGWPVEPIFGAVHSDRLPEYFRVDGRITRYQRIAGRTGVFYLEMLDLNGRRNIVGYQYDASYAERTPVESFFARRTFVLGGGIGF